MKFGERFLYFLLAIFLLWSFPQKMSFDRREALHRNFLSADKDNSISPVREKEGEGNKIRAVPPPTSDRS